MTQLLTTPPLSPKVIALLSAAGIRNQAQLKAFGALEAFALLRHEGLGVAEAVLWQLMALAEAIPLSALSTERKAEVRQALKRVPPQALPPAPDEAAHYMRLALQAAHAAATAGEVPVGAVVVCAGECVGVGHNRVLAEGVVSAHAELQALQAASARLGTMRLMDCDVYITLEPCVMCAGALLQARVRRVIYAAAEPKTGAAGSVVNVFAERLLNQHTAIFGGVLAEEAAALLQDFFVSRRA